MCSCVCVRTRPCLCPTSIHSLFERRCRLSRGSRAHDDQKVHAQKVLVLEAMRLAADDVLRLSPDRPCLPALNLLELKSL